MLHDLIYVSECEVRHVNEWVVMCAHGGKLSMCIMVMCANQWENEWAVMHAFCMDCNLCELW
jgi:hypothetical protein